jgi:pimeloyl-ACP methyl ester carboxylesterase
LLGGSPEKVPERYKSSSPMELLPIAVPQRVIHGEEDDIVPFAMSRDFAQASKNARLIAIPHAGHFELIDPRSAAWPTVLANITQ